MKYLISTYTHTHIFNLGVLDISEDMGQPMAAVTDSPMADAPIGRDAYVYAASTTPTNGAALIEQTLPVQSQNSTILQDQRAIGVEIPKDGELLSCLISPGSQYIKVVHSSLNDFSLSYSLKI